jgi:transposase
MTTATTQDNGQALVFSLELGARKWLLTFGAAGVSRTVRREVNAWDQPAIRAAIGAACARLGLPATAPKFSCYEAGRDGFAVHRLLESLGVRNLVVDPSSIPVNRRSKQRKTDRLDGEQLLARLLRHLAGLCEQDRLVTVRVPTLQEEMNRVRDRDIAALKKDLQRHRNRIKSLLATMGAKLGGVPLAQAHLCCCWDGAPLPTELQERLQREQARLALTRGQIKQLEDARRQETARVRVSAARRSTKANVVEVSAAQARARGMRARMETLKGVGPSTASILTHELFEWRAFRNVRELASFVGLTPAPWQSGSINHEQGITKAGNKLARWALVQLAHGWLQHQPESALTAWWTKRFGSGSARTRKVGIVALARKLLLALWKYVRDGELPAGATLKAT